MKQTREFGQFIIQNRYNYSNFLKKFELNCIENLWNPEKLQNTEKTKDRPISLI